MSYCVGSGGKLLRIIVWGAVEICYGLLCGELWDILWTTAWRVVGNCYVLWIGEWWVFVMSYCVVSDENLLRISVW
jgi:hypothetical protein